MKVAEVQFTPWDKSYRFDINGHDLQVGSKVIVKTELGTELGEVVGFSEFSEKEPSQNVAEVVADSDQEQGVITENSKELKPIVRLATAQDIQNSFSLSDKKKTLDYAREVKIKFGLPMKFIDVHFAFDGSRITFAFIADGRVDFREMVKDMTRHFGKTIRLQQIGIRDEAKITGDAGHCGRQLCCRGHLKNLESITSEMAELQQCSHRGSERISGICGRLMCCLAYEENGYEELRKKMPDIGTKVNVDGKRGTVVGHQVLKQFVNVQFQGDNGESGGIVEVDLNRKKKK
jgi:cell fate regulator YaaT (PSP1 superfamily)